MVRQRENIYLEVKGYYTEKDKIKMEAVEEFNNIRVRMIFEDDLIDIEKNGFYV